MPDARSDRTFDRGNDAIAPDAAGHLLSAFRGVPFCIERKLRARHPRSVPARMRAYSRYCRSDEARNDQPSFPTPLFVV